MKKQSVKKLGAMRINMRAMATPILEEVDNNLKIKVAELDVEPSTDVDLETAFTKVAKAVTEDGQSMGQQAVEAWLTKAQVIDGKSVTQEDFASSYQKLGKPNIGSSELAKLLADLASSKNLDLCVLKYKLNKAE